MSDFLLEYSNLVPNTEQENLEFLKTSFQELKQTVTQADEWSPQESKLLKVIVKLYCKSNKSDLIDTPDKVWQVISKMMNKSKQQCQLQAKKILRPKIHQPIWNKLEDKELANIVMKEMGNGNDLRWTSIAQELAKNTNTQVRIAKHVKNRWINKLNQNIQKGPWDISEDKELFLNILKYGKHWQQIAKNKNLNRTENSLKNRYYAVYKKLQAKNIQMIPKQEIVQRIKSYIQSKDINGVIYLIDQTELAMILQYLEIIIEKEQTRNLKKQYSISQDSVLYVESIKQEQDEIENMQKGKITDSLQNINPIDNIQVSVQKDNNLNTNDQKINIINDNNSNININCIKHNKIEVDEINQKLKQNENELHQDEKNQNQNSQEEEEVEEDDDDESESIDSKNAVPNKKVKTAKKRIKKYQANQNNKVNERSNGKQHAKNLISKVLSKTSQDKYINFDKICTHYNELVEKKGDTLELEEEPFSNSNDLSEIQFAVVGKDQTNLHVFPKEQLKAVIEMMKSKQLAISPDQAFITALPMSPKNGARQSALSRLSKLPPPIPKTEQNSQPKQNGNIPPPSINNQQLQFSQQSQNQQSNQQQQQYPPPQQQPYYQVMYPPQPNQYSQPNCFPSSQSQIPFPPPSPPPISPQIQQQPITSPLPQSSIIPIQQSQQSQQFQGNQSSSQSDCSQSHPVAQSQVPSMYGPPQNMINYPGMSQPPPVMVPMPQQYPYGMPPGQMPQGQPYQYVPIMYPPQQYPPNMPINAPPNMPVNVPQNMPPPNIPPNMPPNMPPLHKPNNYSSNNQTQNSQNPQNAQPQYYQQYPIMPQPLYYDQYSQMYYPQGQMYPNQWQYGQPPPQYGYPQQQQQQYQYQQQQSQQQQSQQSFYQPKSKESIKVKKEESRKK